LCISSYRNNMDIHDFYNNVDELVLAILIFLVTVYVCNVARKYVVPQLLSAIGFNGSEYRLACDEMIGTMETATISYELNFIIWNVFGAGGYVVMLFMFLMWQNKRASEFHYIANPAILVTKHIKGHGHYANYVYLLLLFLGEMAGAALAYQWVTQVCWKYSSHWTFWKGSNYHMSASPYTELNANVNLAMMVEGGFTFAGYAWPRVVHHHLNFGGDAALILINAGKAIFSGIAQPYTGGFFNPIIASSLEYNTGGHSLTTKFQVYWICPIAASIVAMYMF